MKQIAQLAAASAQSTNGSICGVFEISWRFVVVASFDKNAVATLDETGLRSALGGLTEEMVGMTKDVGNAIEIGSLIEIRDDTNDKPITLANVQSADEVPLGTVGALSALDGTKLVATLEKLAGKSGISGAVRQPDGSLNLTYDGQTDVFWDEQKTVQDSLGRMIFLDENGEEYPEDQVKLVKNS